MEQEPGRFVLLEVGIQGSRQFELDETARMFGMERNAFIKRALFYFVEYFPDELSYLTIEVRTPEGEPADDLHLTEDGTAPVTDDSADDDIVWETISLTRGESEMLTLDRETRGLELDALVVQALRGVTDRITAQNAGHVVLLVNGATGQETVMPPFPGIADEGELL